MVEPINNSKSNYNTTQEEEKKGTTNTKTQKKAKDFNTGKTVTKVKTDVIHGIRNVNSSYINQ
jgi:hypothetical protein